MKGCVKASSGQLSLGSLIILILIALPGVSLSPTFSALCPMESETAAGLPVECKPSALNTELESYQPVEAIADIIIAIDTSDSMKEETDQVMKNINLFGKYLESENIDFRVIIVGQSRSPVEICVEEPLAESQCAKSGVRYRLVDRYVDSFNALAILSDGKGGNSPRRNAWDLSAYEDIVCANNDPGQSTCVERSIADPGYASASDMNGYTKLGYASFMRKGASKTIIVVTDDTSSNYFSQNEECAMLTDKNKFSPNSKCVNDFIDTLRATDRNLQKSPLFNSTSLQPEGFVFHTIDGNDCEKNAHGYRRSWLYQNLADRTGGSKFKVCKSDWSDYFKDIASAVMGTVDQIDCEYSVPRDQFEPEKFFAGRLSLDTPFNVLYSYESKSEVAKAKYTAPANSYCPDGTTKIDINFDEPDTKVVEGTLRYYGEHGFAVYFTDDKSGSANGVEITSQQSGNCVAANNCEGAQASAGGNVLGANDRPGSGTDPHTSGIIAVFNQGATRVSFMDMDDDWTTKSVFAYDENGVFIGQSQPRSKQEVYIDTSMTSGKLIYSLEFDTKQGTSGGAKDGTVFTIDNFHAEGLCEHTQVSTNGLIPCRSCRDGEFVNNCFGNDAGICVSCASLSCPPGFSRTGCGGFGSGECIKNGVQDNLTLVHSLGECPDGDAGSTFREGFLGSTCPVLKENTTGFFKVDSLLNPRKITFCSDFCSKIRKLPPHIGQLGFQFRPISRLQSVTVGGRGVDSAAALGRFYKMRPAVAAVGQSVEDFYGLTPVSSKGSGNSSLFSSPGNLFDATDGKGIAIFFFVDGQGNTWFGFQFGNEDPANVEAVLMNIVLSGTAARDILRPRWRVQNGNAISLHQDWNKKKGGSRGNADQYRVFAETARGGTAGGMLGPLPVHGLCIDVEPVERTAGLDHITLINYKSLNEKYVVDIDQESKISKDVVNKGGIRLCADSCSGDTNTTAMRCMVQRTGEELFFSEQDVENARSRNIWNHFDLMNITDEIMVTSPSSSDLQVENSWNSSSDKSVDIESDISENSVDLRESKDDNGTNMLPWLLVGGCALTGCVVLAIVLKWKRRKVALLRNSADVEMSSIRVAKKGHRKMFSGFASRHIYWVPPPPVDSNNPLFKHSSVCGNVDKNSAERERQRKRKGRSNHLSPGFEAFQSKKRASTFQKFFSLKNQMSSDGTLVKERGPSLMNVASSDWDVFHSDEHNSKYYHNRKTGETRWTCPPEVNAALEKQRQPGTAVAFETMPGGETDLDASKAQEAKALRQHQNSVWKEFRSDDGHPYYCNMLTREVRWLLPEGGLVEREEREGEALDFQESDL